ncbi:MAG: hypothetical protein SF052_14335 [Bacteroidia bacterium]|nr:hypothetical protein [Bacteroidia bacterium]
MAFTKEEIQQLLSEVTSGLKDSQANFKEIGERFKNTDDRFKDLDTKLKETDKRINAAFDLFEGQWGKLMESLIEGDLVRLLQERGIAITQTSERIKGSRDGQNYEFDIIAHNGHEIVVVEVKTTLRVNHVKDFLQSLANVKTWLKIYNDFHVYGAIAYLKADEQSTRFAEKQGLFVIRATGNSASITNPMDFVPRVF